MTSIIGGSPPLHRRFDESKSIELIQNRYRNLQPILARQVEVLQKDVESRIVFRDFYDQGFKDWHLVSAVFNIRMNWYYGDFQFAMENPPDSDKLNEIKEIISLFTEPPSRFANAGLIEQALRIFDATVLMSHGFHCRRSDYKHEAVRNFLRNRMRHYDLDIPHQPLFGKPPGNWPDCNHGASRT
jgi:hypothetical protein